MLLHAFTALFVHYQASDQGPSELLSQEKPFSVATAVFYKLYNGQVQVACMMACIAL